MTRRLASAIATVLLTVTSAPGAQAPAAGQPMSMTGVWELGYDSRRVPLALLTPEAAKANPREQLRRDIDAIRWCHLVGLPLQMDYGGPISIVQGRLEVAISADGVPSHARHIYLNAAHPDMDAFDPQVVGHSTGRWEGDALLADTVGFSERGVTSLPGGGWRTERSHLVERYRLLDAGRRLSVTFTWQDASVFLKPHSYEFIYTRAPLGTSARTLRCDASDQQRAAFLLGTLEP
jgi:hypothetical protein